MDRRVAPSEWVWVGIASVVIMLVFSAPYLVGYATRALGWTFGGFLFGMEDMHSYLAKMRYGAYDGWLFRLVYTTEPHRGAFVFGFHLLLGKLAAWITGQGARVTTSALVMTYHVARILCGLLLLAVMYRFMAEYLETPATRRLAWALAAMAGGLGWIPTVIDTAAGAQGGRLPVEFYVPEAFTLLSLYGLPHLALARSLLLGGWLALFSAVDRHSPRRAIGAGLAWLGMGVIVPFYVALLGVLIAAWLGTLAVARRRLPWAEFRLAALAGALPVLALIYNAAAFATDPVFTAWSAQNLLASPPLVDTLLAYGLLILLAIPGVGQLVQGGVTPRASLLIIWPVIALLLAYLPINVQRRLLEGVIIPLCVLAAVGVWRLVGEKPEEGAPALGWRLRQAGVGVLLACLFPSAVLLIGGGALTAARPEWSVFHSVDELAALDWLRREAPFESIVLSTYDSGNVLPAYAGVRVYVGHGPETIGADVKNARTARFFDGAMSPREQQTLLEDSRADYVWVGLPEQAGCGGACLDAAALGLRPVFEQGSYTIYEVQP